MKDEQIIKLICTDMSAKEIGLKVNLTGRQVNKRIEELAKRHKVRSRYGLMIYVIKNKIVEI